MVFSTLVTTEELTKHLGDPAWRVFDCRFSLSDTAAGEEAYRHSHIPAAHYVHLERDLSSPVTADSGRHPLPARETLIIKLGEWGVAHDSQVVVYDDANGAFAARLWWLLRWLGHERVAVLDGGWAKWLREGHSTTAGISFRRRVVFQDGPSLSKWVTVGEVQDGLALQTIQLIDARSPGRFRGELEPIDSIAGHVPGAVNRPFQNNLGEDGRFLPAHQLRDQIMRQLGRFWPEQAVHMCGSGVTACHNLLAMEIAGLKGSRIYAGSWSEWIRDPSRPVAKAQA